jgi:hypothetical protein
VPGFFLRPIGTRKEQRSGFVVQLWRSANRGGSQERAGRRRDRVVLTDEELEAFMARPDAHPERHTMALVSQTPGGPRTSDLHAWDGAHIHIDVLT